MSMQLATLLIILASPYEVVANRVAADEETDLASVAKYGPSGDAALVAPNGVSAISSPRSSIGKVRVGWKNLAPPALDINKIKAGGAGTRPGDKCDPGITAPFCSNDVKFELPVTVQVEGIRGLRGTLIRQGVEYFKGPLDNGLQISFSHQGEEFMLQTLTNDDKEFFDDVPVAARGNELCGASAFPEGPGAPNVLQCDPVVMTLAKTIPVHDIEDQRGFGLEFEYVSLPPSQDVNLAKVQFDGTAFVGNAAEVEEQTQKLRKYIEAWLQADRKAPTWDNIRHVLNVTSGMLPNANAIDLGIRRMLHEKHRNWLLQTIGLPNVHACFQNVTKELLMPGLPRSGAAVTCASHDDCKLASFCNKGRRCLPRGRCRTDVPRQRASYASGKTQAEWKRLTPVDDMCPYSLASFSWVRDNSVLPMMPQQVSNLIDPRLADRKQTMAPEDMNKLKGHNSVGVGFEVVTVPMFGRMGLRAIVELLSVLNAMGIQAGPSAGLHVHANVISDKVEGKLLTIRGIANVWIHWAMYQLVIDEFMSPGRIGNTYARRHIVSHCRHVERYNDSHAPGAARFVLRPAPNTMVEPETIMISGCKYEPYLCIRRLFRNLHKLVQRHGNVVPNREDKSFMDQLCQEMMDTKPDVGPDPCTSPYPHQRYFQFSLVPLFKFGTLEARVHAATTDADRIQRWVRFLLAFIKRFGVDYTTTPFLSDANWHTDFEKLRVAQLGATFTDFAQAMRGVLSDDDIGYFKHRRWEWDPSQNRRKPECAVVGDPDIISIDSPAMDSPRWDSPRSPTLFNEDECASPAQAVVYDGSPRIGPDESDIDGFPEI